jgi:tRNA G18 (ribose-2'-O)-methylase SpoU
MSAMGGGMASGALAESDFASLAGLRDRELAREGLMLLEGSLLLDRAMEAGVEVIGVACVPGALDALSARSRDRFPLFPMAEGEIARAAGYPFHRGVLGVARRPRALSLGECPPGRVLCLWELADPANLGALARSGAALGADAFLIGKRSADIHSRIALRSSMGALLSMPVIRAPETPGSAVECVAGLESMGKTTVAAVSEGGEALDGFEPCAGADIALFLGNEGSGLSESLVKACRARVTVPMSGRTDSLNVAAAGAILMWALFRNGK